MNDTSLKAEQVQLGLLRAAGVMRRVELVRNVSASVIDMSRRAIARCHPDWSELDVKLEFVKLNYGEEMADRVRHHIGLKAHGVEIGALSTEKKREAQVAAGVPGG